MCVCVCVLVPFQNSIGFSNRRTASELESPGRFPGRAIGFSNHRGVAAGGCRTQWLSISSQSTTRYDRNILHGRMGGWGWGGGRGSRDATWIPLICIFHTLLSSLSHNCKNVQDGSIDGVGGGGPRGPVGGRGECFTCPCSSCRPSGVFSGRK